jgi:tRNA(adenine34) deaminase
MKDDEFYMNEALLEAKLAASRDEVPIGAVLVDSHSGEIIARDGNRTIEVSDPTAHAEILVVREACKQFQTQRLPEYDLFVTLEPCPMCASALSFARLRRIIFGAYDEKSGGLVSGAALHQSKYLHHKPEVIGGILSNECSELLKSFFALKRERGGRYHGDKTP